MLDELGLKEIYETVKNFISKNIYEVIFFTMGIIFTIAIGDIYGALFNDERFDYILFHFIFLSFIIVFELKRRKKKNEDA